MSKQTPPAAKRKVGRPKQEVSNINTVRQVGRWTDEDWGAIKAAAKRHGVTVAAWCKSVLIHAAFRA